MNKSKLILAAVCIGIAQAAQVRTITVSGWEKRDFFYNSEEMDINGLFYEIDGMPDYYQRGSYYIKTTLNNYKTEKAGWKVAIICLGRIHDHETETPGFNEDQFDNHKGNFARFQVMIEDIQPTFSVISLCREPKGNCYDWPENDNYYTGPGVRPHDRLTLTWGSCNKSERPNWSAKVKCGTCKGKGKTTEGKTEWQRCKLCRASGETECKCCRTCKTSGKATIGVDPCQYYKDPKTSWVTEANRKFLDVLLKNERSIMKRNRRIRKLASKVASPKTVMNRLAQNSRRR